MALSASQHVELIDAAIVDVIAGRASSYSIGNRSVTKHDITKLYELRNHWAVQAERERSGGIYRKAAIRRPSP